MGQAEQVGGEGRQHRRQRRITEGKPCVHSHNEPPLREQEDRRKPQRHAEQDQVSGAAADPVAEQGHQQAARRAAHAAQHHAPQGSALVQAPLHAQL